MPAGAAATGRDGRDRRSRSGGLRRLRGRSCRATGARFSKAGSGPAISGYVDADGYPFIVGRVKELINRGGFKVSPSAVDAALCGTPEVADAVTFARAARDARRGRRHRRGPPRAGGLRRPRRCVISRSPTSRRSWCRARSCLDAALPRSVTGKLAARRRSRLCCGRASSRPLRRRATVARKRSRGSSREVLGVGPVGAFDNFFELGGDSLRGAQLVSRFNAATRVESRSRKSVQAADSRGIREPSSAAHRGSGCSAPADSRRMPASLSPGRCRHRNAELIDAALRRDRPRDRARVRRRPAVGRASRTPRGRSSSSFLSLRAATAT